MFQTGLLPFAIDGANTRVGAHAHAFGRPCPVLMLQRVCMLLVLRRVTTRVHGPDASGADHSAARVVLSHVTLGQRPSKRSCDEGGRPRGLI